MLSRAIEMLLDAVDRVLDYYSLGQYGLEKPCSVCGEVECAEPIRCMAEQQRELNRLRAEVMAAGPGAAIPLDGDPRDLPAFWDASIPPPMADPPFDWSREPDRFPASPPTMIVATQSGQFGGRGRRVEV